MSELLDTAVWRRSARCVSDHHCVEVADLGVAVGLRNSQRPTQWLTFSKQEWRSFLDELDAGEFRPDSH
jgi:hypothetical protein